MLLRPLQAGDEAALAALHAQLTPAHRRWSAADLREQFADPARGRGAHVVVAEVDGRPAGMAAWVDIGAGSGEFYGSPVVAERDEVAAVLIARVMAEGRAAGADWVRIGAWPRGDGEARRPRAGRISPGRDDGDPRGRLTGLSRAAAAAGRAGPARAHAMIAASNGASLALHRRRGFTERERLTVLERRLAE